MAASERDRACHRRRVPGAAAAQGRLPVMVVYDEPAAGVLQRLRRGKHLFEDERLGRLSGQEERILKLIADGRTNRQIGEELELAEKTVKNYVSNILGKLDVGRRAEAAAYLARHTQFGETG